ncbi:TadE family protein [Microbacterium sp. NPDC076911]|uniref:TadE/TadG family type IV pilus assembly protein n=1 Tax=Microbacterium sp. NPDC076911 TaxID=3154958 RepID=UPI003420BAE2
MHPQNLSTDPICEGATDSERGSAALEFILVGIVLLVPLVYLILALGQIQGQTLGAEAGARHIARTIATSSNIEDARSGANRVLASVAESYGMEPDRVEFAMECRPVEAACPSAGATVIVTLTTTVTLPLMPSVLGIDGIATVPVAATAAQKMSRFWGTTR